MYKRALVAGVIFAALAVILGAFGAHALKKIVQPEQVLVFETGVRYQFYHSFALIITGILYGSFPFRQVRTAYLLFVAGIALFSGSLYLLTFFNAAGMVGIAGIGILTPFGGLFFIAGWLMLLMGIIKKRY